MIDVVFMMGSLGLLVGAGLAIASKVFYVYVDPKILEIEDTLPGANCGGCGVPGCSANAEAIVAGRAAPNSCVAAGSDVAEAIAAIMGVSVEAKEPDIARPGCTYGVAEADTKFVYDGLSDCRAAALLSGGMKVCTIGCLGLGTCERACPFNAIVMGPEGLPVVDELLCTGCGTCENVCPKNIINLSSTTRRILKEYKTDDCTTPCQRACPAGINICEYIRQISIGDYHRAVQVIKERNPLPAVIGRICPRPCENECRRQFVDESVAINFLKRFAADYEIKNGSRIQPYKAPPTNRHVAVIGGGVEGLSASFFLARLGHAPLLHEATSQLGGLLRSAIASDRLPAEVLDWDIDGVLEMGVEAKTEMVLGKDVTVKSLLENGNQAVLLTLGGWDSRLARGGLHKVEEPIPGVYLMLDYLKNAQQKDSSVNLRGDIVIYGGGRLALDTARTSRALGRDNVTVVMREKREDCELDDASVEELSEQNVRFLFNTGIDKIYGEENRLNGVDTIDLHSKEKSHLTAGTLVIASGRLPEMVIVRDEPSDIQIEEVVPETQGPLRWVGLSPYKEPTFRTEVGLFSKGDAFTDFSAAIKAIGAGRRIAASVHEIMYGIPLDLPDNVVDSDAYVQNVDHVEAVSASTRRIMPLRGPQEEDKYKEIELGFDEGTALAEAERCLQCGLICYRHSAEPTEKVA
jgi:NADPH-dependent glutamate synthase beta subunit-like oxidoreductase